MVFRPAVVLAGLAGALAAPADDLLRAKTRVPRDEFCGRDFADMGAVLTRHLRAALGDRVLGCDTFSLARLQDLQARLLRASDPELVAVYAGGSDNRRERHTSEEALRSHWEGLLAGSPPEAHEMLRDGLCHEVVMRFVHHTAEGTRKALAEEPGFALPTLPQRRHTHDGRAETRAAYEEYKFASGCQVCHSRLVPPPSPPLPADCKSQLTSACGKYGQLGKDLCTQCTAQHAADIKACSPAETQAFCGHAPACLGSDECPVWPEEFYAPFTLHFTAPTTQGYKSNFYYKYNSEIQAQTVDYPEKCIVGNSPCKLYFLPKGIYLSQPGRVDCCMFFPDVGAAPPEFLQSFTLSTRNATALDMYGNEVKCDEWTGPDGFIYWTVGKGDTFYKNVGHDVALRDGASGPFWRWGNFTVAPQSDSLFQLPAGDCEAACPKFLTPAELRALHQDHHVRRSVAAAGRAQSSPEMAVVV